MKPFNRLLSALLSAAVVVAATVLTAEVIADRAGRRPAVVDWHATYRWAQRTTWDTATIRTIFLLLALLGLVLLTIQLVRGPIRWVTVGTDTATDTAYTRSGIGRSLQHAAAAVDGIGHATTTITRRRIHLTAHTTDGAPATAHTRDALTRATQTRLDTLQLRRPPKLAIRISTRRH